MPRQLNGIILIVIMLKWLVNLLRVIKVFYKEPNTAQFQTTRTSQWRVASDQCELAD